MDEPTITRLAKEVLAEMNVGGRIFAVDHVVNKAGVWAISISTNGGFVDVSINTQTHSTLESIKAEIQRQLREKI